MLASFIIKTNTPTQIIEITSKIGEIVQEADITSGLCTIFCPHTTAGVMIAENFSSPRLNSIMKSHDRMLSAKDFEDMDNVISPRLKTMLTGNSVTLIINDGRILLGEMQGIFLCDFTGNRKRQILVKILEESQSNE